MLLNRCVGFDRKAWLRGAFAVIVVASVARGDDPKPDAKPATASPGAGFEVILTDGSTLRVTCLEERIEFQTRYGKLHIPATDLRRIEFRSRLSSDVARKVEAAIIALASKEFREREKASSELARLGERALPALMRAAGGSDAEVGRRAKEIVDKLHESLPAERLDVREDDTVWAGGSQIVGRIATESLHVQTLPFGEQTLRLADVRSLRSPGGADEGVAAAAPDPGSMVAYQEQVGKTFTFKVTGRTGGMPGAAAVVPGPLGGAGGMRIMVGSEPVWGTGPYTIDSPLALTAVHAGVLRAGQSGVVKVKVLGPQPGFQGSSRNGVTTMDFGPFPGYSISR
jgi:hypothetical protein